MGQKSNNETLLAVDHEVEGTIVNVSTVVLLFVTFILKSKDRSTIISGCSFLARR